MSHTTAPSAHTFHIPVMGTGFTIDTPLRVARYGISSVIAMGDDVLMEQMHRYHAERLGEAFTPVDPKDRDVRARRITAYLDFIDAQVKRQVRELQAAPFEPGSEITRYFEMLPDGPLRAAYQAMQTTEDPEERRRRQDALRPQAVPGSIDANIMTKVDGDTWRGKEKLPPEYSTAMAGLRGYAGSVLDSALVLSAGMNPRLYAYIGQFGDFFPDDAGRLRKRLILKVSDYRSAEIQGKYLAKRGLWISEYRIESGLNCGGHAFATDGYLLGPILEEFQKNRQALLESTHTLYVKALGQREGFVPDAPLPVRVTVQGGIGTADEHRFLLQYYRLDGAGWGTPFLLVPEATNLDDEHLRKLEAAGADDVFLSDSSPFGIPFWTLRDSASEQARKRRIESGKPGSPCPRGLLKLNNEFTEVGLCTASRAYIKKKLADLRQKYDQTQLAVLEEMTLAKACICYDLAGGATVRHGIDPKAEPAVCCGPNIAHFSRVASLEEMVSHIYGRISLLAGSDRPHMFVGELRLYLDYLRKELARHALQLSPRQPKYFADFKANLLSGIDYYAQLSSEFAAHHRERFLTELRALGQELEAIAVPSA